MVKRRIGIGTRVAIGASYALVGGIAAVLIYLQIHYRTGYPLEHWLGTFFTGR